MVKTRRVIKFKEGDYVIASYQNPPNGMYFCVGYFVGMTGHKIYPKYLVADNDGELFWPGGFERAQRILPQVGDIIVKNKDKIVCSGANIWYWVRLINKKVKNKTFISFEEIREDICQET